MNLTRWSRTLRSVAPLWVAALWWASLGVIGFLVVPLLFANLPTPAMAGAMAAKLFAVQTWVSVMCGLFLFLNSRENQPSSLENRVRRAIVYIALGMLLALLAEFAVAPRIIARENLAVWHGVGSAMYLLQWWCAGLTLWKLSAPLGRDQV
jgi:hypothetical protein